jgi:hypothetical protein
VLKKFVATRMGFLGGRRIREGETIEIETELDNPASWLKPFEPPVEVIQKVVLTAAERIAAAAAAREAGRNAAAAAAKETPEKKDGAK